MKTKYFITFNLHTFHKGKPVRYNDHECIVTKTHDLKNGKKQIFIKERDKK